MFRMTINYQLSGLLEAAAASSHEYSIEDILRIVVEDAIRKDRQSMMQEFRILLADHDEQLLIKVERMIDGKLEDHVPTSTSTPKPETQLTKPLPSPDQIAKMEVELCENFHIPKEKRGKMPLVQLRIRIDGHKGYWLMPLHRPNHVDGRKRIKPIMDQIDAVGRDTYKYAGCRGDGVEQAYVDAHNQLRMRIAGHSFEFTSPKMKADDADKNAPPMRWFHPD